MLLYAQSLRGGNASEEHGHEHREKKPATINNPVSNLPPWIWITGIGGTIAVTGGVVWWRKGRKEGGELDLGDRFNEEAIDTVLTDILAETELPALPPTAEPVTNTRSG